MRKAHPEDGQRSVIKISLILYRSDYIVAGRVEILLGISTQVGAVKNADELKRGLEFVKAFFGSMEGWSPMAMAKSVGYYGGQIEDCLHVNGWVPVKELERIERFVFGFGKEFKQMDVFLSVVVNEDHPNARPMVYYRTMQKGLPATLAAIDKIKATSGIDGFLIDDRGQKNKQIMGVFAQYIPEIIMRFEDDLREYSLQAWKDAAANWLGFATKADGACGVMWVSTRVFGKEETTYPGYSASGPTLLGEISRRYYMLATAGDVKDWSSAPGN